MNTQNRSHPAASFTPRLIAPAFALVTMALAGCGGGSNNAGAGVSAAAVTAPATVPPQVAALPTYHLAPVILEAPSSVDASAPDASAAQPALQIPLSEAAAALTTARLTPEDLRRQLGDDALAAVRVRTMAGKGASPAATTVYTPAQIRSAYQLPALPAAGASLSASVAAGLGAGQTIYLIDANDNPNALSDLNTFSTTFGLPTCTQVTINAATALPLAAPAAGCQFAVVYANASGGFNGAAPSYDSSWAMEIALDVQWAHAIAPLARIVLFESASSNLSDLAGSIQLANRMGPGVMSMSFGAAEGSWVTASDSYFTAAGITYLASTGDSGAQVNWPAVSSKVLAVGGTSLQIGSNNARAETAWSDTGGGISAYESLPGYQSGVSIHGGGALHARAVADVSFNADPNTGQYLLVTPPGGSAAWYSGGGTSIASPQWAGILALANAARAQAGVASLGDVHAAIYTQIAAVPGNYAAALSDITSGADGTCATCAAGAGYDQDTGWGTPNFTGLLNLLKGASTAAAPPLPPASLTGTAGIAFSTQWPALDAAGNALAYTLSGAPAGLTVSGGGLVSWTKPVAGTYTFTVNVVNKAGLKSTGTEILNVAAQAAAPTVPGGSFSAAAGVAFSQSLNVTVPANSGTVSYQLAGQPGGLGVSSSGVLSWASPVAGTYTFTAKATNAYGKSATGTYHLAVVAGAPPVFGANRSLSAAAGAAYAATITATDPNHSSLSYTLAGGPAGLVLSGAGALSWSAPAPGSYTLAVTARDALGFSATASFTLKVLAPPYVYGGTLVASAGYGFSVQLLAGDPNNSALAYALSGAPAGLVVGKTSGVMSWSKPVHGTYAVSVTVTDALGLTASAPISVVIQ